MAPASDLYGCLSFSVPSPSRGHTATAWPKAPTISHLVGVDSPVWPKAPDKARPANQTAVPSQEWGVPNDPGLLS